MKKIVLGAAIFLLISATHASATGLAPQHQPGAGHNILSSQLPVALLADINEDYKGYWITALSEEGKGKHSDYFITLEDADQIVQLRSGDSENWVITSTSVKAD
jgi:hypothetical protein